MVALNQLVSNSLLFSLQGKPNGRLPWTHIHTHKNGYILDEEEHIK